MNKTFEPVKRWRVFDSKFHDGSLEDFFRIQLSGIKNEKPTPSAGKLVPDINGRLVILLRRIGKFHMPYSFKALGHTELDQIEEFGILVTVYITGNTSIKSEAFDNNIMELPSASNMLSRMKERCFLAEYADKEDKRVTRFKVTPKWERALHKNKETAYEMRTYMRVHDFPMKTKNMYLVTEPGLQAIPGHVCKAEKQIF